MGSNTIGIPRGMLYYRYNTLWRTFFKELGFDILVSEPTTLSIAEQGMAITVDEACLSIKIFFGHVDSLIGRCDYLFIPRINSLGTNCDLCPRFAASYDLAHNMFRDRGQRFVTFSIDVPNGESELKAYISLGQKLGCSIKHAIRAYKAAVKEDQRVWREKLLKQKQLFEQDGLKILIAGHDYLVDDAYIGKPVTDFLKKNGAVPIRANIVDRNIALKRSLGMSPTCKWQFNREIIGGISVYRSKADGIIFLSAFPCGPDAMVNELMLRRIDDLPMLNLVMDGQNGTAGTETRLESFLDIIRFKRGLM